MQNDPADVAGLVGAVVAGGGLAGLARATTAIDELERARTGMVSELRRVPAARWEDIGRACHMTRQGAQRRWSRDVHASSFGAAVTAYDRARPGYPLAALDWLLPPGARRVLDLAAGTGKLTRLLLDRGLHVTAVEPSPQMRDQLSRSVPGATVLAGSAEDIPLPSASVDAVLVAQAWHWVEPSLAIPQIARVLVPGGQIGLTWNIRDSREPWVSALGAIMHQYSHQRMDTTPDLPPPFECVERFEVGWTHRLTVAQLVDLVASRSYVITLPDQQRSDLLADVAEFISAHPALAGKDEIELPYVTACTRARLR